MRPLPEDLAIRARKPDDYAYLLTTFLHTAHNLALFQGTPQRLYTDPMAKLFRSFIDHPRATTAVVCEREDPDWIIAWMSAWILRDVSVIWYAYTRATHRRQGVCDHLVSAIPGSAKASVFTSKVWHRINQKHKIIRYPTLILEVENDNLR